MDSTSIVRRKLSLLFIVFLLIQGCSSGKNTKSIEKKISEKQENLRSSQTAEKRTVKKKVDSPALKIVRQYLDYLANGNLKKASDLTIHKKYNLKNINGDNLSIFPIKENPFDFIKVTKIEETKAQLKDSDTQLFTYSITADIKWENDNRLMKNVVFFINALKESNRWKVDGISTEF